MAMTVITGHGTLSTALRDARQARTLACRRYADEAQPEAAKEALDRAGWALTQAIAILEAARDA